MIQPFLSILIPTYNRVRDLKYNLMELIKIIKENNISDLVDIIISDNNSNDNTNKMLQEFLYLNSDVKINVKTQEVNIGAINNMFDLLSLSNSTYVMYIGDDDYISKEYLLKVISILKNDSNTGCIVPSYQNISPDKIPVGIGRDIGSNPQVFNGGFRGAYQMSWRGHQMSGLVFNRQFINQQVEKYSVNNYYLFIFFVLVSSYKYNSYLEPEYPILVTRPGQKNKTWNYNDDGLVSDIFNNYKIYNEIPYLNRCLLQLKILDTQYWRYCMYLKKGITYFLKSLWLIFIGENTLFLTKFLFPIYIPIILLKKLLQLLFTGKLIQVFKTKVDL